MLDDSIVASNSITMRRIFIENGFYLPQEYSVYLLAEQIMFVYYIYGFRGGKGKKQIDNRQKKVVEIVMAFRGIDKSGLRMGVKMGWKNKWSRKVSNFRHLLCFFGCCGAKYFAEIVTNKRVADSSTFDTKYRYVFWAKCSKWRIVRCIFLWHHL